MLLFSASLLSGCASLWPRRVPREILTSSDLLQRIQARNRRIHSIRAQAKVTVNLGKNRFRLEELIIVKKPASLRVEALSLIGQPLLYLTTDGEIFEILIPTENRYYRGTSPLKHLPVLFPFCQGIKEIIPMMVGEVSWADDEHLAIHYSQGKRLYIIEEDISEGSRRVLWINPFHFALVRAAELDHQQNPQWEALFSSFRKRDGILFPTDIEFRSYGSGSRMKMHLIEWEINPSLGEGIFRLDTPKGVEIIEMK